MKMKYLAYPWPEYQDYMGEEWFRTESYYDSDKDVYLIPEYRVKIFDKKMCDPKYKIGDTVTIKSTDWYNDNKDILGNVVLRDGDIVFITEMSKYCGEIATIIGIEDSYYALNIDNGTWDWSDEMFEEL